jgi:hypothetical protein
MVVFKEAEDAEGLAAVSGHTTESPVWSDLGIMRVLDGFLECSRSEVMLLPRGGYAVVVGGRRGGPDVLMGFG